MRPANQNKQSGFTLIELMISMVLGLVVVGMMIGLYGTAIKSNVTILSKSRLQQDVDAVLQLMVGDIRRAGYWGGAMSAAFSPEFTNNAYNQASAALAITANKRCITFSYDKDNSGAEPSENEYFGYKLVDKAIYARHGNQHCASAENWDKITNNNLFHITHLSFERQSASSGLSTSGAGRTQMRAITINLSAALKTRNQHTYEISKKVLVRNPDY